MTAMTPKGDWLTKPHGAEVLCINSQAEFYTSRQPHVQIVFEVVGIGRLQRVVSAFVISSSGPAAFSSRT